MSHQSKKYDYPDLPTALEKGREVLEKLNKNEINFQNDEEIHKIFSPFQIRIQKVEKLCIAFKTVSVKLNNKQWYAIPIRYIINQ